jgi:hypothetical protein
MTLETLGTIELIVIYILGIQVISSILLLILGNTMMDYFKLGFFENTDSLILKMFNAATVFFIGAGYFSYKRLLGYSWIKRKLMMTGSVLLILLAAIILYQVISGLLRFIFI